MYVVRSKRGKPVARFQTKREAEVFIRVRSARRPGSARSPGWDERNGMVIELSEWADYPLVSPPGYMAPIANDAGMDVEHVLSLYRAMLKLHKRRGAGAETDRTHHELGRRVQRLIEQVKHASKGQIEGYVRAREAWINS